MNYKFIIDKNIPFADSMYSEFGEIVLIDGHAITPQVVKDADALLVRSVTRVNETLLAGSKVQFVGTATIGYDHVDVEYLNSKGIVFASAPGSNSNSVAEYLVAALLVLSLRYGYNLKDKTIGVVGIGNVGSKVVKNAKALGMNVLQNDPPIARVTSGTQFISLDELMEADIISLHVPLTMSGEDATYHFFDDKRIGKMKAGSILINTSRGGVVETQALKNALKGGHLQTAVLDVWENEPNIDMETLALSTLGTPHIAGYSTDGKANGALMIYEAVCKHFGFPMKWSVEGQLPKPSPEILSVDEKTDKQEQKIYQIVKQCYPIERDDVQLRVSLDIPPNQRVEHFNMLRAKYPVRREFFVTVVRVLTPDNELSTLFSEIGFQVKKR